MLCLVIIITSGHYLKEQLYTKHIHAVFLWTSSWSVSLTPSYVPLSHLMAISPPTLSLPLTQCLLDFLSCLSHSFPIITSPLYAFCRLLSVHLLASFFSLLPRGSAFNTGIRGQALNIFHLVMPRGGHHPGFVVLTHWFSLPCYIECG